MPTYYMKCSNKKCTFENSVYHCSIKECDKQKCPKCGEILKIKPVLCENGPIIHNMGYHGLKENWDGDEED